MINADNIPTSSTTPMPGAAADSLKAKVNAGATPPPPASMSNNTVPMKPKRKLPFKMILGVLALFIVVGGAAAGYYLTQMRQDVRQQAAVMDSGSDTSTPGYIEIDCCVGTTDKRVSGTNTAEASSNCKNQGGSIGKCTYNNPPKICTAGERKCHPTDNKIVQCVDGIFWSFTNDVCDSSGGSSGGSSETKQGCEAVSGYNSSRPTCTSNQDIKTKKAPSGETCYRCVDKPKYWYPLKNNDGCSEYNTTQANNLGLGSTKFTAKSSCENYLCEQGQISYCEDGGQGGTQDPVCSDGYCMSSSCSSGYTAKADNSCKTSFTRCCPQLSAKEQCIQELGGTTLYNQASSVCNNAGNKWSDDSCTCEASTGDGDPCPDAGYCMSSSCRAGFSAEPYNGCSSSGSYTKCCPTTSTTGLCDGPEDVGTCKIGGGYICFFNGSSYLWKESGACTSSNEGEDLGDYVRTDDPGTGGAATNSCDAINWCWTFDCPNGDTNGDLQCLLDDTGASITDTQTGTNCAPPPSGCGQTDYFGEGPVGENWQSYCAYGFYNLTNCNPGGTPPPPPTYECNSSCTTDAQCEGVNSGYFCSTDYNKCRLRSNPGSSSCKPATGPQCLSIAINNVTGTGASPKVGDEVNFTCGTVAGADHYVFRIFAPGNADPITLAASGTQANVSENYTISSNGKHAAQCQICTGATDDTCLSWEPVTDLLAQNNILKYLSQIFLKSFKTS